MRLIPWSNSRGSAASPTGLARQFRSEFDRLFDRFIVNPWSWTDDEQGGTMMWSPTIDIGETDGEITVRAEVPGLDAEDLQISIAENVLTISGEKKDETEDKGKDFYHCESRYGSFRRIVELPAQIESQKVTAECADGVLTVHIPRSERVKPRQIEVKPATTKTKRSVPVGAG
jgi:HSP20 family protein